MKFFIFLTACLIGEGNMLSENTALLWKITGSGLEKPSYLFGTFHTIPHQFLDSVPGFYDAFNSANVYVGEIDPSIKPNQSVIRKMYMPKDTTYMDLLDKPDFDFLDSVVHKYTNTSVNQVNLRPFPIAFFLSQTISIQEVIKIDTTIRFMFQGDLDGYLWKTARENNIPTYSLENQGDRDRWGVADLSGLNTYEGNLENQARELIVELKTLTSELIKESINFQLALDFLYAYYKQNLDKLEKTVSKIIEKENYNKIKAVEKILTKNRNIFWMEKIPTWLKNNSNSTVFIAVGALHLTGEYGLISLLQKEGYIVEPVIL